MTIEEQLGISTELVEFTDSGNELQEFQANTQVQEDFEIARQGLLATVKASNDILGVVSQIVCGEGNRVPSGSLVEAASSIIKASIAANEALTNHHIRSGFTPESKEETPDTNINNEGTMNVYMNTKDLLRQLKELKDEEMQND